MKSIFKQFLTCCGVSLYLAAGIAHAGQATIPNTFSSGAPANAADVNENFSSMKTAIDDNDTRVTQAAKRFVAVDVNDQIIAGVFGGDSDALHIFSSKGFYGRISKAKGFLANTTDVFFTGPNCDGTPYIDYSRSMQGANTGGGYSISIDEVRSPGNVFTVDDTYNNPNVNANEYWYVPITPNFSNNMPVQSVKFFPWGSSSVICDTITATIAVAAEVFPNDPAITGIPNAAFAAPIRPDYR